MATHPDYPGASSRLKRGKVIWRYRAPGVKDAPQKPLYGEPGTPEFDESYELAVMETAQASAEVVQFTPSLRTFDVLAKKLWETAEWSMFDQSTRKKNAMFIERFMEMPVEEGAPLKWRDTPFEYLEAPRLRDIITKIQKKTPTQAKHMLVALRKLIWAACQEKWIQEHQDPSLGLKVRIPKSNSCRIWPVEVREQYERFHPPGSPARTAYALGFWIGNRRGDVASLTWDSLVTTEVELYDGQIIKVEAFDFRQKKNRNLNGGKEMFVPLVAKLKADLSAINNREGTVLKNSYGEPYSEKTLTNMMADWTRQAGLPKGYTLHGLRRTFGSYLAECNIQTRVLMDAMGHSHFSSTEKYVRDANRKQNMILVAQTIDAREERRDANRRRENIRVVK